MGNRKSGTLPRWGRLQQKNKLVSEEQGPPCPLSPKLSVQQVSGVRRGSTEDATLAWEKLLPSPRVPPNPDVLFQAGGGGSLQHRGSAHPPGTWCRPGLTQPSSPLRGPGCLPRLPAPAAEGPEDGPHWEVTSHEPSSRLLLLAPSAGPSPGLGDTSPTFTGPPPCSQPLPPCRTQPPPATQPPRLWPSPSCSLCTSGAQSLSGRLPLVTSRRGWRTHQDPHCHS